MTLSKTQAKTQDKTFGHCRKSSEEHAFVDCTSSYSADFFSLTRRTAIDDKNSNSNSNNNMIMSQIHNLNSQPPQSPSEKMMPVKKHHRRYHVNRPRSKSESETSHPWSHKKIGTNSPGGHYCPHVLSPTSVSSSFPKYRSLGKMWIRPVSVKKNQCNQVVGQQQGMSSVSHPTMPFFPDFGYQSTPIPGESRHEDVMFSKASNSSFHAYQRSAELSTSPSKKLAFTFGESGKPIKSSMTKRHSPTSVI
eukprot:CAMPEP_0201716302 /NCGR_PEP_ID=MMETSP0593-20130828/2317_1 /ASSEMBLY_ACC=CAM_ASM_000672 /TAXON_ID=267983 /ORGANISM="Skeletonema japonicum, Strain CCMP2506" /LENGTH=248 /DNA_ID=CAMNT_0048206087 /DNA_START=119 /DNA_END=865 /DNA_ORIENTATION=-